MRKDTEIRGVTKKKLEISRGDCPINFQSYGEFEEKEREKCMGGTFAVFSFTPAFNSLARWSSPALFSRFG
ncbi:hypothetical protein Back11_60750 [Paenibacillus baekrokdamisoli]|uniref:Uncharacterized protein n=1 Tax=Paenibacillus baekrokdamisoli TaxID=1712516 RepID=A0A3G9J0P0_9BACL|nr:hypothetical protein Back11_60750 [Paenibacillus baekrokdamisoli]